jgi:SAM-dependent methyltransferase
MSTRRPAAEGRPAPSDQPELPAEALARLYDFDLLDDPGDLDLWLALAGRAKGPVLELMAGSGRLAVPLAEEGYRVTAVDLDATMLARAERRASAAGTLVARRLDLVHADVVGLELAAGPTFGLAFVGLNSILLLRTRDAQRAAWRALAAHLAPGGVAAVDAWLPDAADVARYDGRLHLEYVRPDPDSGRWITKSAAAQHDGASRTVALTTIYEEGDQGEPPVRWIRRDVVRLTTADEQRAMAEEAGLLVELVAGGYDLEPIGPHDERAIVIARKPGQAPRAASRPARRRARTPGSAVKGAGSADGTPDLGTAGRSG